MKLSDLRSKSVDELVKLLIDFKKEKLNLNLQKVSCSLKSPAIIRKTRKSIAQIKTLIHCKKNS